MEVDQLENGFFDGYHDNGTMVMASNFQAPYSPEAKLLPEVSALLGSMHEISLVKLFSEGLIRGVARRVKWDAPRGAGLGGASTQFSAT